MATSPEYVRLASSATRPLTDAVFDALREAVVVVDAKSRELPVVMANSAARRCLLGNAEPLSPASNLSLCSLLATGADSAIEAALGSLAGGKSSATRVLTWRFPRGEMPISTELKLLVSAPEQWFVMLT